MVRLSVYGRADSLAPADAFGNAGPALAGCQLMSNSLPSGSFIATA